MSRLRTNFITNRMANGAPTVSNGLVVSGVTTTTSLNVTGNVSVGGTLTYEDVTNIDSVGIGTFGEGIFVPDDKSIRVGGSFSNPDLKIHSSSTYQQGVIDYNRSGTGRALRIRATNLQIENWNGLTPTVKVIGGAGAGHVELNYAGSKKFETTSSGVSIGGTTIITSASGGKLGIGTDIPATLLHLFGTSGTEKLIRLDSTAHKRNNFIGITGSDNLVLGADEDNEGSGSTIRFRIDGSEKVRITSGGRVAIGTDSGGNNDTDDIVVSGSGKRGITVCSTDGSECRLTFADGLSGVNAVAGNITYDHSVDRMDFYTNTTRRVSIKSDGKVGVGTDSPLSVLTAYGENRGEGTVTGQITAKDNAAYNASPTAGLVFQGHYHSNGAQAIFAGITGFKENATNGNLAGALALHVRADGSVAYEAARITSAGRFGIGENSPDTPLHVKSADNVLATFESTDADALIEFKDNGTSDTVLMGAVGGNDLLFRTDLGDMIFRTNNNATDALRIHNNGNISAHVNNDSYELTLQGRTGAAPTLWLRDGGTSSMPRIIFGDTGNALQGAITYNNGDDALRIHTGGESSNPRLLVTNVGEVRILPTTSGSDRTQFSFNNTAHTPFISFKSNNVNEAAEIRVEEDGGGANIVFKNKNRNSLLHTAFQIDWDHGLYTAKDGHLKTYPFIMGMYTQHDEHEGQFNYHDIRSPSGGIGGWVFLGYDYGPNPYPVRTFKIAVPEGGNSAIGTRVYQLYHNGDANYDYGGLYEIRINQWNNSSRFESVSIRCINGKRDDVYVVAYNNTNGIMVRTSTIWGSVYLRKAGWDENQLKRGSSYCAVENNGALAIYNAQGTDDGTVPTSGSPYNVYCFDAGSHTGGRDIENNNNFAG